MICFGCPKLINITQSRFAEFNFAKQQARGILMFNVMKRETTQQGVTKDGSNIVETLDKLMLELRRLNQGQRKHKAAIVRLNQETRALLEQIQTGLNAV
jgi:hypothetical protein